MIPEFIAPIKAALEKAGIQAEITSRTKSVSSIYNKMLRKQITEYSKTNQMAAKRFQEMLEETIRQYHERRKHLTAEEAGAAQEETSEEIIRNHMWPFSGKHPKTKEAVIVAAADGSRIRLAGDGTRLVGHPNNLYRIVIHRFLVILCEILLGQDTNSIGFGGNIGGAGIYIPIDPLIADAAQEDGLVVAGIGGLGGIVRAHIGFQAKAHHRVVLTGHILRLAQRRLSGTGERERKRRQGKNPFIRNTSHFQSNHYYSDPPHLPSGSQPVRW